jgi:hypothetical protein
VFGTAIAQASAGPRKIKLKRPSAGGLWPSPFAAVGYNLQAAAEVSRMAKTSRRVRKRWPIAEMDQCSTPKPSNSSLRSNRTCGTDTWRCHLLRVHMTLADDNRPASGPGWAALAPQTARWAHTGGVQDSLASGGNFFNSLVTASFQAHCRIGTWQLVDFPRLYFLSLAHIRSLSDSQWLLYIQDETMGEHECKGFCRSLCILCKQSGVFARFF